MINVIRVLVVAVILAVSGTVKKSMKDKNTQIEVLEAEIKEKDELIESSNTALEFYQELWGDAAEGQIKEMEKKDKATQHIKRLVQENKKLQDKKHEMAKDYIKAKYDAQALMEENRALRMIIAAKESKENKKCKR